MERQGKAKLYRLEDERDWLELGIGYASCSSVGDGTYEIVLEPLDADDEPWRQRIDESTDYVLEEMIIQWHSETPYEGGQGENDGGDFEGGTSHALSFENEQGCIGVMSQIEQIQSELRVRQEFEQDDAFEMPEATVGNLVSIENLLMSCQSHIKKHTVIPCHSSLVVFSAGTKPEMQTLNEQTIFVVRRDRSRIFCKTASTLTNC